MPSLHFRLDWLVFLAIIAAAAAGVYFPGLSGGYVFDDFPNIVKNDELAVTDSTLRAWIEAAFSSDSGPFNRPLAMLSFAIERYVAGLNPLVMKCTNLAIHILNAWLIFAFLYRLGTVQQIRSGPAFLVSPTVFALLVAVAWGIAPINLTGVLYVVQRMESLATLAMLIGLLAYLRGRLRLERGQTGALRWLWGGIGGGMALGVLAKESAVMLPVYALLVEAIFFGFGRQGSAQRAALARLYIVLLVLPGLLGLARLLPGHLDTIIHSEQGLSDAQRLGTQARVLWHYIAWTLAPSTDVLSLYHDDFPASEGPLSPWTTLPAAIGLVALAGAAWIGRQRVPWISFGVLWFFVMHLLVSSILDLELVYEHRNYLGSMGLITALFGALLDRRMAGLRLARGAVIMAVLILFAMVTTLRSHQWGDPIRHALVEAEERPDSPRAGYTLAINLIRLGAGPGSEAFDKGVELLRGQVRDGADNLFPWVGLIMTHSRHDLPVQPSWWEAMDQHLEQHGLADADTRALKRLVDGVVADEIDLPRQRMEILLDRVLQLAPNSPELITLKANYLAHETNRGKAVYELLKKAAVVAPQNPKVWRNLIQHQVGIGLTRQAVASIDRLRELNTAGQHSAFIRRMESRISEAQQ